MNGLSITFVPIKTLKPVTIIVAIHIFVFVFLQTIHMVVTYRGINHSTKGKKYFRR